MNNEINIMSNFNDLLKLHYCNIMSNFNDLLKLHYTVGLFLVDKENVKCSFKQNLPLYTLKSFKQFKNRRMECLLFNVK